MTTPNQTCFFLQENLEQTEATKLSNVFNSVLNSIFMFTAIFGNSVVLSAFLKTRVLHSPSYVLLCCLATSDLLVGLACQPTFVALKTAELMKDFDIYCKLRKIQSSLNWTASGVSWLTLCAVAVDKLLALDLHLRYNYLVTVPRVFGTVIIFWVLCVAGVVLRFWIKNLIILPAFVCPITLLITTLSIAKIFYIVRKHHRQIGEQQQAVADVRSASVANAIKWRKSAITVLYVYALFVIFYFPIFVIFIVQWINGYTKSIRIAYDYAVTVVFINSSLNPVLYCWRISKIRNAVKGTFKKASAGAVTDHRPTIE